MRKLAAIMFTDVVGYTAHMARNEHGVLKLLHESREVLKPLIKAHGGQWLKEMGLDCSASRGSPLIQPIKPPSKGRDREPFNPVNR